MANLEPRSTNVMTLGLVSLAGLLFSCAPVAYSQNSGDFVEQSPVKVAVSPGNGAAGSSTLGTADPSAAEHDDIADLDALLDADLETLRDTRVSAPDMNMEVTSVSRTEVSVAKTPAAIFVITSEMIRRSSAANIPDLLRMVPGLHVARASNGQWSIGVRGSAGVFTDALLVQVDGRSIYTPAFGGVLWQIRDMPLTDIERIEVIRGPGASVWGANAVNGVINIVTKHSKDTVGTLIEGAAGTELRQQTTVRYGNRSSHDTTWRIWGRRIDEDGGLLLNNTDEVGNWQASQFGFRIDKESDYFDEQTVSGGLLHSGVDNANVRPSLTPPAFASLVQTEDIFQNYYFQSRQVRRITDDESFEIQSFVDLTEQDSLPLVDFTLLVADVGFQHRFKPADAHDVVWGANYRLNFADVHQQSFQLTAPGRVHYNLASLFIQDTIALHDEVALTLGSKLSWNDQTDFELQPTARMVWNPTEKCALWASVSRAVRLPAFLDSQVSLRTPPVALAPLPTFVREIANPLLDAETLVAVEGGIRTQPSRDLYWDNTVFHFRSENNITSRLDGTSVLTAPPGFVDLLAPRTNGGNPVDVSGFESYLRYTVNKDWSVAGSYSYAMRDQGNLDRYPVNMVYAQSSHNLCEGLECDLIWRFTDTIESARVASYNELDVRFSYQLSDHCELSLVGRDLLDAAHQEDSSISTVLNQVSQVQRGVFGMIRLNY